VRRFLLANEERPLARVPRAVVGLLVLALIAQVGWQGAQPRPVAQASALRALPATPVLQAASLGEPVAFAQLLSLYLQAFDNQPGISIPFLALDYARVITWLKGVLDLDPAGQYPLMMASQLYGRVPDAARQRQMFEFVHQEFLRDPNRRWRWLAHAAIMAKHRLGDPRLALRYAEDITRHAGVASGWARQMRIFMLEDLGEVEEATILLGGLLATGEVTDEREIRFLTERLQQQKAGEIPSVPSKTRHPESAR